MKYVANNYFHETEDKFIRSKIVFHQSKENQPKTISLENNTTNIFKGIRENVINYIFYGDKFLG